MQKIKQLPPNLIAQIAAGEVIERPSYAVKELIDNALDAGADEINVTLENCGLKKITIADNGSGMSKDDLFESYKIHTTSKIENEDSLNAIKSMGFRGEALASIASISNLTIKSKTAEDIGGHFIDIYNGKLIKDGPVGMGKGTIIEIENIFVNIPARKKFLKSPTSELRYIIDVFISFALTFPEIKFSLTHNKKVLYQLPKTTDLLTRSSMLLSKQTVENFISINKSEPYLKVIGFIAKPQFTTTSNTKQYLFVNKRRITDKIILQAIKDSYQTLIPDKQQPVFLLFLSVPFELVDVNVHPRKEQLAFYNTQVIYDTIFNAITETLKYHDLNFNGLSVLKIPITNDATGNMLRSTTNPWQVKKEKLLIDYKTIQQVHNLYIIVQTKHGILFVDQHAAHERILFEQYKKEFLTTKNNSFTLQKPITLEFTISEQLIINEYREQLTKYGVIFNETHGITHIPVMFKNRDIKKLIKELLENLEQGNSLKNIDQISHKIVQFLACKNAIKAGDTLTKTESIKLIKKLEQTENNYTCPHGRPTKNIFSLKELNRLFKRF